MGTVNDYTYQIIEDQQIMITRYEGNEKSPFIPAMIEGLPVTVIGVHAFAGTEITDIDIPEGIRKIDKEAFGICDFLKKVTLPRSLKELGESVFMGSESLTELSFPNGNDRYFLKEGILFDKKEEALVFCPPGLDLEVYDVPDGTKVISSAAFYMSRKLKYIRFPDTLKKIESAAFLFTDSLSFVDLPPDLEELDQGAFLMMKWPYCEKEFVIHAFPGTSSYECALQTDCYVVALVARIID